MWILLLVMNYLLEKWLMLRVCFYPSEKNAYRKQVTFGCLAYREFSFPFSVSHHRCTVIKSEEWTCAVTAWAAPQSRWERQLSHCCFSMHSRTPGTVSGVLQCPLLSAVRRTAHAFRCVALDLSGAFWWSEWGHTFGGVWPFLWIAGVVSNAITYYQFIKVLGAGVFTVNVFFFPCNF